MGFLEALQDYNARALGEIFGDYDYSKADEVNRFGHSTDLGKLPWHPTFSDQSAYNSLATPAGHWNEQSNSEGKLGWNYQPSLWQMKQPDYINSLQRYYNQEAGRGIDTVTLPIPYRQDLIKKPPEQLF